ncbi:MAG: HPP family protein [Neisseriaceae bacterium]|nr:HPP family protein [Neisseriaceae bacterium]MBP6862302.1 HPP family protein [Neisseriaceae bacterium]
MKRMVGGGVLPAKASYGGLLRGFLGGVLSIVFLGLLQPMVGAPLLMAPFGASCVLLFAASSSPLAQPRNVIGGHLLSAGVGLLMLHGFGSSLLSMAIAVGLAIVLMQWFRMVHPPAGGNPLVVLLAPTVPPLGWDFLLFPVLFGAVGLVLIAALVNNVGPRHAWPVYWRGGR